MPSKTCWSCRPRASSPHPPSACRSVPSTSSEWRKWRASSSCSSTSTASCRRASSSARARSKSRWPSAEGPQAGESTGHRLNKAHGRRPSRSGAARDRALRPARAEVPDEWCVPPTRRPEEERMTTSRRLAVIAGTLQAQDFEKRVDLHGFGGWRYGKTDVPNDYLGGTKDGDYREADFALNTSARVSEHLRMVSQVDWHESKAEKGVDLEYAFAEWKFSDKLLLRAGKVKQPFGLYSEVFQVGTLRPFLSLPQGVYGPSSIIGLSYKGLGLTGAIRLGKRWGIQYDVYGGGTDLDETIAPEAFLREGTAGAVEPIEREQTRNVIGGRISFETPVEGLRFGGAAFSGIEIGAARRTVAGVHAEYVSNKLSLRSEYAHENVKDDLI